MKLNIQTLLRRIPIILLEDAYLHESITTIIWLMIALSTNKFKMKKYIYEWILGFLYICCITKKKDNIDKINIDLNDGLYYVHSSSSKFNVLKDSCELLQNNAQESLFYALYFRIAYGGKEHDMAF